MENIWRDHSEYKKFVCLMEKKQQPVWISSQINSGLASFFAEVYKIIQEPWIFILPDKPKVRDWTLDLRFFTSSPGEGLLTVNTDLSRPSIPAEIGSKVIEFPEWENGKDQNDLYQFNFQLSAALNAVSNQYNPIVSIPAGTLASVCISPESFHQKRIELKCGDELDLTGFLKELVEYGYERSKRVENKGEFSYRGGILDIFIPAYLMPVRIEFFGDEIVSLREFDPLTQRSISRVKSIDVIPTQLKEQDVSSPLFLQLKKWFTNSAVFVWLEPENCLEILKNNLPPAEKLPLKEINEISSIKVDIFDNPSIPDDRKITLNIQSVENFNGNLAKFFHTLKKWNSKNKNVQIIYHREMVRKLLEKRLAEIQLDTDLDEISKDGSNPYRAIAFTQGKISNGFSESHLNWIFISENDIIGRKKKQHWFRSKGEAQGLSFQDLKPGDFVVHLDHGVGKYEGLFRLKIDGRDRDFLLLSYADNQKLYIPVRRMDLIQKYVGISGMTPVLDKIGGISFKKKKRKVKEAVLKYAAELAELFSARERIKGFAFPKDSNWQQEFEIGFEYEETPDQLKAINDIKSDMEMPKPMDRLICGDVGYGKTEVAMRAAFKAVDAGKQVCVLVPTTILAQQHFRTFHKRFKLFPVKIAMLSRFLKKNDAQKVKHELAKGKVDIIIGTHALLNHDVDFKDLGLVIIDEEQRFGVRHKEQLKKLRTRVDVLTLTATPIPRTLNMSLLGLKDISLINTPPEARHPIITKISKFDLGLIRNAILKELDRNGQVYFVHNRIQSIKALADILKKQVPEARFEIAHGQMPESQLERIMLDFLEKKFDVLISTTIIESGLDIPSVNTIIINRADRLGLSQLYQLRGRVGRDRVQAYAYCLIPSQRTLSQVVKSRLKALQEASELSSSFKLAMRDLEIRGAGDILGPNQHGHISAVGFELYCRLVRDAVKEIRGEQIEEKLFCEINLPVDEIIPESFIPDPAKRLDIYNRFAKCTIEEHVEELIDEINDWFGEIPSELKIMSEIAKIRIKALSLHITRIDWKNKILTFIFKKSTPVKPENIMTLLIKHPQKITFEQPDKLIVRLNNKNGREMLDEVKSILDKLIMA